MKKSTETWLLYSSEAAFRNCSRIATSALIMLTDLYEFEFPVLNERNNVAQLAQHECYSIEKLDDLWIDSKNLRALLFCLT